MESGLSACTEMACGTLNRSIWLLITRFLVQLHLGAGTATSLTIAATTLPLWMAATDGINSLIDILRLLILYKFSSCTKNVVTCSRSKCETTRLDH